MTQFGPIDTQVAQAQSAAPQDLAVRVQVTQLQAEVAALTQQVRDRPQSQSGSGEDSSTALAQLETLREIRDSLNEVKSQLNSIEEAIRD